jgi:hypothetical protein
MNRHCFAFGEKNAARWNQRNLSGNLLVQLGLVTEELNRSWYEANTGSRTSSGRFGTQ